MFIYYIGTWDTDLPNRYMNDYQNFPNILKSEHTCNREERTLLGLMKNTWHVAVSIDVPITELESLERRFTGITVVTKTENSLKL